MNTRSVFSSVRAVAYLGPITTMAHALAPTSSPISAVGAQIGVVGDTLKTMGGLLVSINDRIQSMDRGLHSLIVAMVLFCLFTSPVLSQDDPVFLMSLDQRLFRINASGDGSVEEFPPLGVSIIGMTVVPPGINMHGCQPGDVIAIQEGGLHRLYRVDGARVGTPALVEVGRLVTGATSITFRGNTLFGISPAGLLTEYDPASVAPSGFSVEICSNCAAIGGVAYDDAAGLWWVVGGNGGLSFVNDPPLPNSIDVVGGLGVNPGNFGIELYQGSLWMGTRLTNGTTRISVGRVNLSTGAYTEVYSAPTTRNGNTGFVAFADECLDITAHPGNTTGALGQSVVFSVRYATKSGSGPVSVLWRLNGLPLAASPRLTTSLDTTTATLAISNLNLADAGTYDCIVTSAGGCGSVTSNTATLTLGEDIASARARPVGTIVTLSNVRIANSVDTAGTTLSTAFTLEDDTGALSVFTSNAVAEAIIQAATNDGNNVLSSITGTRTSFNGLSQIESITEYSSAGIFVAPSITTVTAADFVPGSTTAEGLESRLVRLNGYSFGQVGQFQAIGYTNQGVKAFVPTPAIVSQLNVQLGGIPTGLIVQLNGVFGQFDTTDPRNDGYELTVTSIIACPSIGQQPSNISSCLDGTSLFSVSVIGTAPFTYQWRKNSMPIDLATNASAATATLTLTNVGPVDIASYDCVVANACGSQTSNVATLTIREPSDPDCIICPSCASDFDQDGGVTGSDVGAFFVDFESGAACADVDQDGGVTGADIGAFFVVYEAGGC